MKTRSKVFFTDIVKYRPVWMGVATIFVILYHSAMHTPFRSLNRFRETLYFGVDIFLFASGLGCYYSYSKLRNPFVFLKRRILRLAPAYVPFIVVWGLVKRLPLQDFIGNLFGIQCLINPPGCFNWYISGLVVCYFLTPFFFEWLERIQKPVQILYVIGLLLVLFLAYLNNYNTVTVMRLPVYFLGMAFAKRAKENADSPVSDKMLVGLLISGAVGWALLWVNYRFFKQYLWSYGLHWYPFILITPGVCVLISLAADFMEKHRATKWMVFAFRKIGEYSFELYLVQIPLLEGYNLTINRGEIVNTNLNNLLTIGVVVILSVLLRAVATGLKAVVLRCRRLVNHSQGGAA